MPQIIDITYFQKANALNIPLATAVLVANPALNTPNSVATLTSLCAKVEKSILLNALGLTIYNELQLAITDDFVNPLYAKYQKLVEGEEYDGKVWIGLENDYSLIAWKIYQEYIVQTNEQLSAIGNVQVQPQGANLYTPAYKIANANSNFLQGYQRGYLFDAIVSGNFSDWYGCNNDVNVSLYQYLNDHSTDFEIISFKTYESLNSFGI